MGNLSKIFVQMLAGTKYTFGIFGITLLASLPLGLLLSFVRTSKFKFLRWISGGYVWIIRGTPLLLQLFFIYFGLATVGIVSFDRFTAAIITFILNYSAYFCEIFRGGLLSIEKGQYEASQVLGFSPFQVSFRIVVPQMIRVSLPAITNESITLVKDTALVTAISLSEILDIAKGIVNTTASLTAYAVAAVFYLAATLVLTYLFKYFEKKFSY